MAMAGQARAQATTRRRRMPQGLRKKRLQL